jgi:starch phosphorylase
LLDSDVPENGAVMRWITSQLYVPAREVRLLQYALLGIGTVRALGALGIAPSVVHLNEGHAALAALELARSWLARGHPLAEALAEARAQIVFTTHTPVAAGNERYHADEIIPPLSGYLGELGVSPADFLALGRSDPGDPRQEFGLTQFALRSNRSANAVSRRHGEVAREMWRGLYRSAGVERVPITHVTNGVHLPTWMAAPMAALLDRYLGQGWQDEADQPERWAAIDAIPEEELWKVRCSLRASLVRRVRARSVVERLARGETIAYAEEAARTFDEQTLTLGFGRRFASYKRLHLLIQDASRALRLLAGSSPVQVIIAGKAHPLDDDAKRLVQQLFSLKNEPLAAARVSVLEDYDLALAAELTAGCDVWLNVPRPPLEASGTSGMKAVLNGGLHLSVLDGWWCEAFNGSNGWAIASDAGLDAPIQDARDADALYHLLEAEVVPLFYSRDAGKVPRAWIARIKESMRTLGPLVSMSRPLGEYVSRMYRG